MALGNFVGGDGTEQNPYLIVTTEDLNNVRNNLTAFYKLTKSLDLNSILWEPIVDFKGGFDGTDKIISNLKIQSLDNRQYVGFFANCEDASLKNIHIEKANIIGNANTGGIFAGNLYNSNVQNCSVNGSIELSGFCNAGGFAGVIEGEGSVSKCAAKNVNVSARIASGFAFVLAVPTVNCYATGTISGLDNTSFGGSSISDFCSYTGAAIENCYAATKQIIYNENSQCYPFSQDYEYANLISCYVDNESFGVPEWMAGYNYSNGNNVTGTDGNVYKCINYQSDLDYTVGQPPFPMNYAAQPVNGVNWRNYWVAANIQEARTTTQMKTKLNYLGWDFENVWLFKEGEYPTFSNRSTGQLQAMPLTSITVVN